MSTPVDNRRMKFKNDGRTTEEGRRRREDEVVQIRKAKREEQMQKRRNIALSTSSQESQDEGQSKIQTKVECDLTAIVNDASKSVEQRASIVLDIVKKHINSEHFSDDMLVCLVAVRKLLSLEPCPPIQQVINSGVVPILIRLMKMFEKPEYAFEACWCITNIASGTTAQTQYLTSNGAHKALVNIIQFCQGKDIVEQAVWAIGNIAGDGAHFRDLLLDLNAMKFLLDLIKPEANSSSTMKRQVIWAVSNLNRSKKPMPNFVAIKPCIPVLQHVMSSTRDQEMLTDCCWAFSYITDSNSERIDAVIEADVVSLLIRHLNTDNANLQAAAIRAIGNVVSGTDEQTQVALDAGLLKVLNRLLISSKQPVLKEICWTLSNILAGNQLQVQMVLDSKCLDRVTRLVVIGDQRTRKEAIWAVTNATSGATDSQMEQLIEMQVVKYLCESLRTDDARMILVALAGLENCFKYGHRLSQYRNDPYNPIHDMVEECGGLDRLEYLQVNPNQEVFERVSKFFDDWLVEDDSEQAHLTPRIDSNGLFKFGETNGNNVNTGFNF